ncbi:uncharacterized protein JCM6883_002722 [Sporobolomyces salmoneus]|uniref:uncharacterized protein n=1 Tax=Sporobolomyces salmoneus TaxID=183962 RepID=UPI003181688B
MTSLDSASSSFASTSSQFFEQSIAESTSTAPDLSTPRATRHSEPSSLPSLKASLIHLPLELPSPPDPLHEVGEGLVLDEDLEGAPLGFVIHKLQTLGPELLKSTTDTVLYLPPGPTLPQWLRCRLPPLSSSSDNASCFRPSHILGIRSTDSDRTLLLPVHGLLFAAASPHLSILSSRPEKQASHPSLPTVPRPQIDSEAVAEAKADLPIIEINVPSSKAFPLLQGWIYLRSPSLLLQSLLPATPSSPRRRAPPSSLSHLLNPDEETPRPQTPEALTVALSQLPSSLLLQHVHLVHNLWGDVVCLGVSDEGLWKTMGLAWKLLVAALALKEKERKSRTPESEASSD